MVHVKFKSYEDWINEDFATVGAPPAGNVEGMGSVVMPHGDANGSGDTWDSPVKPKRCPECNELEKDCTCEEE